MNILEAQKLVGVNINPAVFIRVGGQERNTATQKSTNCPFYNEVQHTGTFTGRLKGHLRTLQRCCFRAGDSRFCSEAAAGPAELPAVASGSGSGSEVMELVLLLFFSRTSSSSFRKFHRSSLMKS